MRRTAPSAPRSSRIPLALSALLGTVHAAFSVYWGVGGTFLLETLGSRLVGAFEGLMPVLVLVGAIKLAAAFVPWVVIARRGPWLQVIRGVSWVGAAVLIVWGGANTVVGQLSLAGVLSSRGPVDRVGLVGHAWLWDPLFLAWGLALMVGLARSR